MTEACGALNAHFESSPVCETHGQFKNPCSLFQKPPPA